MQVLSGEETAERVDDIVHLDTQIAAPGLDLTVDEVYRFTGPGHLDFGGGEFQTAPTDRLAPELEDDDDDYGWWQLETGTYLLRYNESVQPEAGELALVTPLERLELAGASHASTWLDDTDGPLDVQLTVGSGGVHLKENFRASRLQIWSSDR